MKNSKDILEHIADGGSCDNLDISSCSNCPLAKLKRRDDDSGWLSCIDAIGHKSFNDIDERYKIIAREILFDIAVRRELEDEAD